MTAKIDQKAYLQKYLGGPTEKKKKKKKVAKGKGFKIIDDDLDLSKLQALDGDELDILDQGEDAPQIAGIIDERPEEVRKAEQFKSNTKWRVINQDDGFNSKLQVEEIKRDIKEVEKENEVLFGKMYSDSEDEKKNDSDLSPPRKQSGERHGKESKVKYPRNRSDSDCSPPRRKLKKNSNSEDQSPPRRIQEKYRQKDEEISPKRIKERKRNYDSDLSPRRKHHSRKPNNDSDLSPPRKNDINSQKNDTKNKVRKSRWDPIDDVPNKDRSISNSPHRTKKQKRSDHKKRASDSDMSRKSKKHKKSRKQSSSSDSDLSPPRKRKSSERQRQKDNYSKERMRGNDSDLSPPRKINSSERMRQKDNYSKERMRGNDSDLSPPRREDKRIEYKRSSDSPPPSNKKMVKTLEGKLAGLQDALQLREENEAFRKRENEAYSKMTDEVSGRNAKAVSRKGKKDTSEEIQKQVEKAQRQKELDEKYKKWSKGLKQIEDHEDRIQDFIHEAAKPFARYKDDKDLESQLKGIERAGDPMLQYIRERKREQGLLGPEKPTYKGQFPPNRFNIRPGYRWDGVDRSNGYESKFFENQSKKKAMQEEAYKWSTEDL